jgi:hypothetical protein
MSYKSFSTLGSSQFANRLIVDVYSKGYNVINNDSQVMYYSYNTGTVSGSNVPNYATGVAVEDAVLAGTTVIQNGKQYMPSMSSNDGLIINRSIEA